jgi:mRNA interferase MazF
VNRGEVWDVAVDEQGRTLRTVVVSGEAWNDGGTAQCVQLVRAHNVPEIIPYIVLTGESDPVTGALDMGWLSPIPTDAFVEQHGMLTGASLAKVSDSLRDIYEL